MDTFAVRRTLKGAVVFLLASLLVMLFGAVLLVGGDAVGAGVLGFGLLLALLLVLQSARPGWSYGVLREGIEVHRAFGTRLIPAAEIASVAVVDAARVEEALAGPQQDSLRAGMTMNFRAGLAARRELSKVILFVTVPVVLSQTRGVRGAPAGSVAGITARARTTGRFALVSLTDGSLRALSPKDVDAFVAACKTAGIAT